MCSSLSSGVPGSDGPRDHGSHPRRPWGRTSGAPHHRRRRPRSWRCWREDRACSPLLAPRRRVVGRNPVPPADAPRALGHRCSRARKALKSCQVVQKSCTRLNPRPHAGIEVVSSSSAVVQASSSSFPVWCQKWCHQGRVQAYGCSRVEPSYPQLPSHIWLCTAAHWAAPCRSTRCEPAAPPSSHRGRNRVDQ